MSYSFSAVVIRFYFAMGVGHMGASNELQLLSCSNVERQYAYAARTIASNELQLLSCSNYTKCKNTCTFSCGFK